MKVLSLFLIVAALYEDGILDKPESYADADRAETFRLTRSGMDGAKWFGT